MTENNFPHNRRATKAKIIEIFQTTKSAVDSWLYGRNLTKLEKPRKSDNTFDVLVVANYILSRSPKGRNQTNIRSRATIVKKHYAGESVGPTSTAKKIEPKTQAINDVGIEFAVERARRFEAELAREVDDAMGDPAMLANTLANWNKTLEILRKTEESCLKILEEKGDLIRMSDVRDLYSKGILPVKTRLMALPVQLAPQLVDQDLSTQIEILTTAFTKVLADCADIWGDKK